MRYYGGQQIIFVADHSWNRITYARGDDWVKTWGTYSSSNDGFIGPAGIAQDWYGNIYVADYGNGRIVKLDYNEGNEQLEYVTSFSIGLPGSVWDIVFSMGYFYVTDPLNHCIYKLSESGIIITSYGQRGTGIGCFLKPSGIAVSSSDVYVADVYNKRIVWLEDKGDHFEWKGCRYLTEWQRSYLAGLAVDGEGYVYVVDNLNCHILKFAPHLTQLLDVFGEKGCGANELFYPRFIHIRGHDVIITEEWTDSSGMQFYGVKPGISDAAVMIPNFDATEKNTNF